MGKGKREDRESVGESEHMGGDFLWGNLYRMSETVKQQRGISNTMRVLRGGRSVREKLEVGRVWGGCGG